MVANAQFILDQLGDFWRRFKETPSLMAYWGGLIDLTSNIRVNLEQIDRGKGLFTVPVLQRSSPVLFVFDSTTAVKAPAGYAASFKIDPAIVSIPSLNRKSDGSGSMLTQGVSYVITTPGVLSFFALPPGRLFAENVYSNLETIFSNFGFPINFRKPNSPLYLQQVQGLWYALWNGAAIGNIELAFNILMGLPFLPSGKILSVTKNLDGTTTVVSDSETFVLPSYLNAVVQPGDVIANFKPISDGTDVLDYINSPDFVAAWNLAPAQKYFTFIPTVLADVIAAIEAQTHTIFDFSVTREFLDRIKPAYTNYVIGVKSELHDSAKVFLDSALIELRTLLSSTVNLNYQNYLILPSYVTVNAVPGANDLERQQNTMNLPEYAMGEEEIALSEQLHFYDSITHDLLVTA